jgi:hypothetical protein
MTPNKIIEEIDNYINSQGAMNGEARRFGYALRDHMREWFKQNDVQRISHAIPYGMSVICHCPIEHSQDTPTPGTICLVCRKIVAG